LLVFDAQERGESLFCQVMRYFDPDAEAMVIPFLHFVNCICGRSARVWIEVLGDDMAAVFGDVNDIVALVLSRSWSAAVLDPFLQAVRHYVRRTVDEEFKCGFVCSPAFLAFLMACLDEDRQFSVKRLSLDVMSMVVAAYPRDSIDVLFDHGAFGLLAEHVETSAVLVVSIASAFVTEMRDGRGIEMRAAVNDSGFLQAAREMLDIDAGDDVRMKVAALISMVERECADGD